MEERFGTVSRFHSHQPPAGYSSGLPWSSRPWRRVRMWTKWLSRSGGKRRALPSKGPAVGCQRGFGNRRRHRVVMRRVRIQRRLKQDVKLNWSCRQAQSLLFHRFAMSGLSTRPLIVVRGRNLVASRRSRRPKTRNARHSARSTALFAGLSS